MNPDTRYQIPDTARVGCIFQIPDTRYHTVSMVSGFRIQIPDTRYGAHPRCDRGLVRGWGRVSPVRGVVAAMGPLAGP